MMCEKCNGIGFIREIGEFCDCEKGKKEFADFENSYHEPYDEADDVPTNSL